MQPGVTRKRACRENGTRGRVIKERNRGEGGGGGERGGGNGSNGGAREGRPAGPSSCICHNLIWLHNRIPARRDHPCQQVTYFFYSTSPSFCASRSSLPCRDFLAANSRRSFDPLSPLARARVTRCMRYEEPGGSFRDNPFADAAEQRRKVCEVCRRRCAGERTARRNF